MPLVTVRAHDSRIEYYGESWKDDLFEIRPDLDPSVGGGVNDTAGGVCVLGVGSRETWGFGNGFRLSFTGVAVRLVMQSRQDHGFYVVNLDGTESTISGYSDAPHCGSTFVADDLPLGKHTVSATLTGKSPASTWRDTYMQMFAIQYDPGEPSNNSTGQTPESSPDLPTPTPTAPGAAASRKAFSAGAIAGVTIAGFVVAFGLVILGAWLVRRCRRQRAFSAVPVYDASEKPLRMHPGKGRRRSVLSQVPSPYMLHPSAPTSTVSSGSPSPSAGSTFAMRPTLPDYARTDSFYGSSASPYPSSPTPAPTSTLSSYSTPPSAQSPSYQTAPLSSSRPSEKSRYTPSRAPEDAGTMLPPYRSN